MFTQCPKCETVFKLSAEVLRAAGGQVRCGRCGEIFNALARLAEDASAFPAGESPLEMEARADEILHSVPVAEPSPTAAPQPEDSDATGAEFARLQVIDLELYGNAAASGCGWSCAARRPGSRVCRIEAARRGCAVRILARIYAAAR